MSEVRSQTGHHWLNKRSYASCGPIQIHKKSIRHVYGNGTITCGSLLAPSKHRALSWSGALKHAGFPSRVDKCDARLVWLALATLDRAAKTHSSRTISSIGRVLPAVCSSRARAITASSRPAFTSSSNCLSQSASRCSRSSSANFHAFRGGKLRIASRISVTVLMRRFYTKARVHESQDMTRIT